MFVLVLNDMRMPQIEMVEPVARAETKEALVAFVGREAVEPYQEPGENTYGKVTWTKNFRKGGPLEWYNPPTQTLDPPNGIADVGTEDSWADAGRREFQNRFGSLPEVG